MEKDNYLSTFEGIRRGHVLENSGSSTIKCLKLI